MTRKCGLRAAPCARRYLPHLDHLVRDQPIHDVLDEHAVHDTCRRAHHVLAAGSFKAGAAQLLMRLQRPTGPCTCGP